MSGATMLTKGRIQPGQSFAPTYMLPLSPEDERTIDRLIKHVEARGGCATKFTTDTTITVRVYPRGEA